MSSSPRRARTPEEKKEFEAKYRVDTKNFGKHLESLVEVFRAILGLTAALNKSGSGANLVWRVNTGAGPAQVIQLNKRQLGSATSKFTKALKELKTYFRISMKKQSASLDPSTLSGTFIPVWADTALTTFFNTAPENFGVANPLEAVNTGVAGQGIMELLPNLRNGYSLRNTLTVLFHIYARNMQLKTPGNLSRARSDDVMNLAFGGTIPAAYVSFVIPGSAPPVRPGSKKKSKDKSRKLSMDEALSQGLITSPLNTYQAISLLYSDFDPNNFGTYMFQNMAASNYHSRQNLIALGGRDEQVNALNDPAVRQALLAEHAIVKACSEQWFTLEQPGKQAASQERKAARKAAAGGQ